MTLHLDKAEQVFWPILITEPRDKTDLKTIDAHSLYLLGHAHEEGVISWKRDVQTAISHYEEAAERGHTGSMFDLGRLYRDGTSEGDFILKPNPEKAFEYFKAAADEGFSMALFHVALAYHSGSGVPRSIENAIEWYKRCGEEGHALFNLGLIYLEEKSLYNPMQAKAYFDRALALQPELMKSLPKKSLEAGLAKQMEEQQQASRRAETTTTTTKKTTTTTKTQQQERMTPTQSQWKSRGDGGEVSEKMDDEVAGKGNEGKASSGGLGSIWKWDSWTVLGVASVVMLAVAFGLHAKQQSAK